MSLSCSQQVAILLRLKAATKGIAGFVAKLEVTINGEKHIVTTHLASNALISVNGKQEKAVTE